VGVVTFAKTTVQVVLQWRSLPYSNNPTVVHAAGEKLIYDC